MFSTLSFGVATLRFSVPEIDQTRSFWEAARNSLEGAFFGMSSSPIPSVQTDQIGVKNREVTPNPTLFEYKSTTCVILGCVLQFFRLFVAKANSYELSSSWGGLDESYHPGEALHRPQRGVFVLNRAGKEGGPLRGPLRGCPLSGFQPSGSYPRATDKNNLKIR